MNNYTPRNRATGERMELLLSQADAEKMMAAGRNFRVKGTVTDLNTGKVWKIRGASCGLPNCRCDATAEEVA